MLKTRILPPLPTGCKVQSFRRGASKRPMALHSRPSRRPTGRYHSRWLRGAARSDLAEHTGDSPMLAWGRGIVRLNVYLTDPDGLSM